MGPAALLASAAFAAYLIGAMLMVRVATVNVQEARKTARLRNIQMALTPRVSKLVFDDLVSFLQGQERRLLPRRPRSHTQLALLPLVVPLMLVVPSGSTSPGWGTNGQPTTSSSRL